MDSKTSKRIAVNFRGAADTYILLSWDDPVGDEFDDQDDLAGASRVMIKLPYENRDENLDERSNAECIAELIGIARKHNVPLDEIIFHMDMAIIDGNSVAGVLLQCLKDHGWRE